MESEIKKTETSLCGGIQWTVVGFFSFMSEESGAGSSSHRNPFISLVRRSKENAACQVIANEHKKASLSALQEMNYTSPSELQMLERSLVQNTPAFTFKNTNQIPCTVLRPLEQVSCQGEDLFVFVLSFNRPLLVYPGSFFRFKIDFPLDSPMDDIQKLEVVLTCIREISLRITGEFLDEKTNTIQKTQKDHSFRFPGNNPNIILNIMSWLRSSIHSSSESHDTNELSRQYTFDIPSICFSGFEKAVIPIPAHSQWNLLLRWISPPEEEHIRLNSVSFTFQGICHKLEFLYSPLYHFNYFIPDYNWRHTNNACVVAETSHRPNTVGTEKLLRRWQLVFDPSLRNSSFLMQSPETVAKKTRGEEIVFVYQIFICFPSTLKEVSLAEDPASEREVTRSHPHVTGWKTNYETSVMTIFLSQPINKSKLSLTVYFSLEEETQVDKIEDGFWTYYLQSHCMTQTKQNEIYFPF